MAKPVSISQTYPRLAVFSEENFRGRRRVYRGNLGISDVDAILTGIESLRFFPPIQTPHSCCLIVHVFVTVLLYCGESQHSRTG